MALQIIEELLCNLVKNFIFILSGDLIKLQAFAHLFNNAIFFEGWKRIFLIVFNLFLNGIAKFGYGIETKVLLSQIIGQLWRNSLFMSNKFDLDVIVM